MTARERFRNVLRSQPVDRLPAYEWVPPWDKTLVRWHAEGMPRHLREADDVAIHFGLDIVHHVWLAPRHTMDEERRYVRDAASYRTRRETMFPDDPWESVWHLSGGRWQKVTREMVGRCAQEQAEGRAIIALCLEGFFWFPRSLLGIERHLLSFYDAPELLAAMNQDLEVYNLWAVDPVFDVVVPDIVVIAEDLSYNHGPMLSKEHFERIMAPHYRKLTARLEDEGILCMVDSDGDITPCASWFVETGVAGLLPLERQAGVDLATLRERHPRLRLIGGYDKRVMCHGEPAMRREFERLLPVMEQGGYIPSADHQTPPDVSLNNYRTYVGLLGEYCVRAAEQSRRTPL